MLVSTRGIADVPMPPIHYRLTRIVSGWLPYWLNKDGQGAGWQVVTQHLNMLDQVSFFSAGDDSGNGNLTLNFGVPDHMLIDEIATLHASDVQALLTVTHFNHIHELLNNPAALANIDNGILSALDRYGFDGVNIDFEDFKDQDPGDAARYTAFLTDLANRLHQIKDNFGYPKTVVATILARTNRGRFTYADETALADSPVDQVRIMAYDEYYPGSKKAGACAPLPWVEQIATYLRGLDAPTWKFVVGVPGYGYTWPVTGAGDWTTLGKGKSVTYPQAVALMQQFNAKPQWDASSEAPYLTYSNGGKSYVAFYENAESWRHVTDDVVAPDNAALGGMAEWAFGDEDPLSWQLVRERLKSDNGIYGAMGLCYTRFGGGARFGEPVAPETSCGHYVAPAWNSRAGRYQPFQNAILYYEWGQPRAYYVTGDLLKLYLAQEGPNGPLGFPISDPVEDIGGGSHQDFEKGTLKAAPAAKEAAISPNERWQAKAGIATCAAFAAASYGVILKRTA